MEDVKKEESKQTQEDVQQTADNQQVTSSDNASQQKFSTKAIVAFFAGILCVLGVAWFIQNNSSESDTDDAFSTTKQTILATVNGETITQKDIDERIQGASQILNSQGVDLSDPAVKADIEKQMLEDTIGYIVLKQKVEESSVTIDDTEVQKQLDTYIQQAGTEENLEAQLQQAGLTLDLFKERIAEQLRIDAYLSTVVSTEGITVSDNEIQAFYTKVASSMGEQAPKIDEVKDTIRQQLIDQKRNEKIQAYIDTLQSDANIQYTNT